MVQARSMQQQHTVDQITAGTSAVSAGGAWVAWLQDANEILITVATLIAIISGAFTLYDRYKIRKANKEQEKE